jgi:adenine-specific DNA-methyltransferase
MSTLGLKGISFIYTHHLGVPYRELPVVSQKRCLSEGQQADLDGNLISDRENLDALKALLPLCSGNRASKMNE